MQRILRHKRTRRELFAQTEQTENNVQPMASDAQVEQRGPASGLPLPMANPGDNVTVSFIRGKDDVRQHLAKLGFVQGAQARVISSLGANYIIEVKGSRIALDGRLASRVMVG